MKNSILKYYDEETDIRGSKIASMRLELSERFTVLKTAAGTGLVQWDTTK